MTSSRLSRRTLLKGAGAAALAGTTRAAAQERGVRVAGRTVEVHVALAGEHTLRVSIVPIENGGPAAIVNDGALQARNWPKPARIVPSARGTDLSRGHFQVHVSGDPLSVRITTAGRLTQLLRVDGASGALTFSLGHGPVFGLGEGGPQFDRRGAIDRMRSGQGGYQLRTHGGRVPVQWLVAASGWAMFIHQPYGAFDLSGNDGRFEPFSTASPLPLDVFVVASEDPVVMMGEYAALTGVPGMPPLWALGYQQSHRTLASREEILEEARTFREKKLPCDALIYLGTGFCPSGWNTDNGEFTFNPKVFPDPPLVIQQLHAGHFKVVLHAVLEGKTLTGAVNDLCTAAALPSGRTPDGKWPDDRQVSCYWPVHQSVFDLGIDGWWPDQGDGLDAPSRLARIRMYYDGCLRSRPNERPFALHRNGHPGMQRYGAFLWSGDVYSTWETLRTHVPVAINTALSGIPFWGTDIGGFIPTREFTAELYLRWFQFGAFCPLFRAHGRTWKLRLPWGWNTGDSGPNEIATSVDAANPDPSELHNPQVEVICRKFLELRSRLMPYLYSAVREAHQTGVPIVRPLWLHYPAERAAVTRGDQYLWGRDILVAPVVEKGATSRALYLPDGLWYDFWTEATLVGGREVIREVDLATMPLFVRAGAIVPLGPVRQYTGEPVEALTTIQVYPGGDGASTLYEDDGATFDFQGGDWMGIEMRWDDRQRRLGLRLANLSRMRAPIPRRMQVRLAGTPGAREVVFTGAPVDVRF
jgi:alpha-glucosidase (family GH31 glycosyl hydrolase)